MQIHKPGARARSPLFFTIGLVAAAVLAIWLDDVGHLSQAALTKSLGANLDTITAQPGQLAATDADMAAARTAWAYIERNTRIETGLVDSVEGFASTTLWDQGSYVLGLVSAYRLGVIADTVFEDRARRLILTFKRLELVDGTLPNKAYNTQTLAMTDYENRPSEMGIGWSALDVARMLIAFRVLEQTAPGLSSEIREVLARWNLNELTDEGELIGSTVQHGKVVKLQEGRIGYEQYGARAAALWGLDVGQAISARRILGWQAIAETEVPVDLRRARSFGAITPVLSEPYVLMALEMGLDSEAAKLASQVYRAQEERYHATGIATMVSEDHVDEAPSFLYASVFSNGREWAVVDEDGVHYPNLRTVSLKASFAWDALYGTDYTRARRSEMSVLGSTERGWPAGYYEIDGRVNEIYTLNTNAIVLQALSYMSNGPLWSIN